MEEYRNLIDKFCNLDKQKKRNEIKIGYFIYVFY